ncbi:MAG: M16 family metallopeptidase [Acidobacteriota bacterium]
MWQPASRYELPIGELPLIQRDTLLTELPILVAERPGSTSVTVMVVIKVGATFDRVGKAGLARLTAECLRSGGGGYDAERVRLELEEAESRLEVDVDWDRTCIMATGPARQAALLIDLLGRLVTTPDLARRDFAEARFKPFQEAAIADARAAQTEEAAADALFFRTLYEAHPYHHNLLGTPESIAAITAADVADFYRRHWLPNNAAVIIVGDITASQVRSVTRRAFGGWTKGKPAPATFLPPNPPEQLRLIHQLQSSPSTEQVHIRLGGILPEVTAETRATWLVLTELLKRRCRPWQLTLSHRRLPDSPWMLSGTCTPEMTPAQIERFLGLLSELRDTPPDVEDVRSARAAVESAYRGRVPNNRDLAQHLAQLETYGRSPTAEADILQRLATVSPEDCHALAREMLGRGRLIAIYGGTASLQATLARFGKIETIQP